VTEAEGSIKRAAKLAKQEAAVDTRYSLLLRLIDEAESNVPFVSLTVLSGAAEPIDNLSAQWKPIHQLQEAKRLKGEARAQAVLTALEHTAEAVYWPYLRAIWNLSFYKESKCPPRAQRDPGALVVEVSKRLANYPGLVEGRAGWMRNSATHLHYEYLVSEDALEMWDIKHTRRKISVDELLEIVKSMYQISAQTFPQVAQLYVLRTFLPAAGKALFPNMSGLLSSDVAVRNSIEQDMTDKMKMMLEPLRAFQSRCLEEMTNGGAKSNGKLPMRIYFDRNVWGKLREMRDERGDADPMPRLRAAVADRKFEVVFSTTVLEETMALVNHSADIFVEERSTFS
jgi:hypothetical protein